MPVRRPIPGNRRHRHGVNARGGNLFQAIRARCFRPEQAFRAVNVEAAALPPHRGPGPVASTHMRAHPLVRGTTPAPLVCPSPEDQGHHDEERRPAGRHVCIFPVLLPVFHRLASKSSLSTISNADNFCRLSGPWSLCSSGRATLDVPSKSDHTSSSLTACRHPCSQTFCDVLGTKILFRSSPALHPLRS